MKDLGISNLEFGMLLLHGIDFTLFKHFRCTFIDGFTLLLVDMKGTTMLFKDAFIQFFQYISSIFQGVNYAANGLESFSDSVVKWVSSARF